MSLKMQPRERWSEIYGNYTRVNNRSLTALNYKVQVMMKLAASSALVPYNLVGIDDRFTVIKINSVEQLI